VTQELHLEIWTCTSQFLGVFLLLQRVVQCVAECCSVVQYVAVCCGVWCVAGCCSVLQCGAVCCSVLQCGAVCCSVLQCVAVQTGDETSDLDMHLTFCR